MFPSLQTCSSYRVKQRSLPATDPESRAAQTATGEGINLSPAESQEVGGDGTRRGDGTEREGGQHRDGARKCLFVEAVRRCFVNYLFVESIWHFQSFCEKVASQDYVVGSVLLISALALRGRPVLLGRASSRSNWDLSRTWFQDISKGDSIQSHWDQGGKATSARLVIIYRHAGAQTLRKD